MIYFELKKIFSARLLLIGIVLLMAVNIFKIADMYHSSELCDPDFSQFNDIYYRIYNGVKGDIDDEKLRTIQANYEYAAAAASGAQKIDPDRSYSGNAVLDMNILMRINDDITYLSSYEEKNAAMISMAEENIAFYDKYGNEYYASVNRQIAGLYSDRSIDKYYDTRYTEMFIGYDLSTLFVLILVIAGLSPVFASEKSTEMRLMNNAMQKGGARLVFAKAAAAAVFSLVITLLFFAADLVAFLAFFPIDTESFALPLYALQTMSDTAFSGSILSFLMYTLLCRYIAVLTAAFVTLAVSSLLKEQSVVFCVSAALVAAMVLFCGYAPVYLEKIALFDPMKLLALRVLTNSCTFLKLFGRPVLAAKVCAFSSVVFIAVLLFVVCLANKNRAYKAKRGDKK